MVIPTFVETLEELGVGVFLKGNSVGFNEPMDVFIRDAENRECWTTLSELQTHPIWQRLDAGSLKYIADFLATRDAWLASRSAQ